VSNIVTTQNTPFCRSEMLLACYKQFFSIQEERVFFKDSLYCKKRPFSPSLRERASLFLLASKPTSR
jgi:hypothetical protein